MAMIQERGRELETRTERCAHLATVGEGSSAAVESRLAVDEAAFLRRLAALIVSEAEVRLARGRGGSESVRGGEEDGC
jgi:hypothetical protein